MLLGDTKMSGAESTGELRVFQCKLCRFKTCIKGKIREHIREEHRKDIGKWGHKSIKTVVDTSDSRTPLREHYDILGKKSAYAPKHPRGIKKLRMSGTAFRKSELKEKDALADWLIKRREKRKNQPILQDRDGLVSIMA